MREVYLDYNASAPLDPRVFEAMAPVLSGEVGNASSVHRFGRRQAAAVDEARERVAALVGGRPGGVVFTAGATEANNLALRGAVEAAPEGRQRILVSAVEHASVGRTARWLADCGLVKLDVIGVTAGGLVETDAVEDLVSDDVVLVSVMAANSETGVLNPVGEIAERVRATGALFHCDATQMAGRLPFGMEELGADLVSVSGHKICGPGGVGALVGARHALQRLAPVIHGGGHERGLRSGSLNVGGIVGLGAAARIAVDEAGVGVSQGGGPARPPGDRVGGEARRRASGTETRRGGCPTRPASTSKEPTPEAVMSNMDPVAVSTGSACSAGSIEPSEVLTAMGLSRDAAFESVRFSLGRFTTPDDIATAIESAIASVERVRAMT